MSIEDDKNNEGTLATANGKIMKALRLQKALTQRDIALKSGLQRKHISALECGQKEPSLATVLRLAEAFEISPAEFVDYVFLEYQKTRKQ